MYIFVKLNQNYYKYWGGNAVNFLLTCCNLGLSKLSGCLTLGKQQVWQSYRIFPQKGAAGDYQTWDPLCSGWTNDCGIQDNALLCWFFFTDNETYRGPPFVDKFYIGNMKLEDVKMWIIHGLEVGSTAEEIYFQWWNWCTGGPWCSFLSAKGIVLFNNHGINAFSLFLLTLCALSRFDNFLIRKLKQNMGDCWQNMGASYKSMGVCCWQRERIIKHQEEFKHETYLNKLRGGQKKIFVKPFEICQN